MSLMGLEPIDYDFRDRRVYQFLHRLSLGMIGLEPITTGTQNQYSTIELHL